jgi:hypothetical protein
VTEAFTERPEDDGTAPFVLTERPGDDETAPFALERVAEPGEGGEDVEDVHRDPTPSDEAPVPLEPAPDPMLYPLDREGRRAGRRIVWALLLDAGVLVTLAVMAGLRVSRGGAGAPDVLLGGLALVLALPCLLAARSFWGLGRGTAVDDAHRFAQGIAHLRGIFVLKATVLFATLGLGCFVFSLIASLLSLL